MKSVQSEKAIPSSINMKSKKNSKDKEKRKSSGPQDSDKGLSTKVLTNKKRYSKITQDFFRNSNTMQESIPSLYIVILNR